MIRTFYKVWNRGLGETAFRITPFRRWIIHEYFKYFCVVGLIYGFLALLYEVIT